MARADNEISTYRKRLTGLLDELNAVTESLVVVDGTGANDTERQAFFQPHFTATPDYDVTAAQFFASVVKLRELQAWLETPANYTALAKMRI